MEYPGTAFHSKNVQHSLKILQDIFVDLKDNLI